MLSILKRQVGFAILRVERTQIIAAAAVVVADGD